MKNNLKKYSFMTVCIFGTLNVMAQSPVFTTAKAYKASVYLNSRAEINERATVHLKKGANEVVVMNVANQMDNSSIRADADKAVTILSASFTNQYYEDYPERLKSPKLKILKDSIEWAQNTLSIVGNELQTNNNTITLLDKNRSAGGTQTGVTVTTLSQLVTYYHQKRLELSNANIKLDKRRTELRKTLTRLKNSLTVSKTNQKKLSDGKIVLQVISKSEQTVQFDVSYVTRLAGWQPFYEIRTTGVDQPLEVITKAKVAQTTGFDWNQVQLSFSTMQPNPNNAIPNFNRWLLRIPQPKNDKYTNLGSVGADPGVKIRGMASMSAAPPAPMAYKANNATTAADFTKTYEQTLSINYSVQMPYDIPSNGKTQTVTLVQQNIPATYNYYAAPKLNKDVYLVAQITDYGKYNLLRGDANIIFDGRYVGKTFLDPSITNDTLKIGLGQDKNIVVKRESIKEKSGNKILSGHRESAFAYKISVRNKKKTTIHLTLKDQFPISTDKSIKVDLDNTDNAQVNEEKGTLTWQLDVAPQSTQEVDFGYSVKYPKYENIIGL